MYAAALRIIPDNNVSILSPFRIQGHMVYIALSVIQLFNQDCNFPCQYWKASLVVPIPKADQKEDVKYYRPMSLLSCLSKLLERHIHNLLVDNPRAHNLSLNNQWGFLRAKSTVTALISAVDKWLQHLQSGVEVCSVFCDLKKAFDTISQPGAD